VARYKEEAMAGPLREVQINGIRRPIYGINAPAGNKSGKFAHTSARCPRVPAPVAHITSIGFRLGQSDVWRT